MQELSAAKLHDMSPDMIANVLLAAVQFGNWQTADQTRALLFLELQGYMLQRWLPQLLLAADERLGFGRGRRMHVGAARRKLVLDLRLGQHRAQIVADLAHDRVWRSNRRHHALPADGDKTRQRFR